MNAAWAQDAGFGLGVRGNVALGPVLWGRVLEAAVSFDRFYPPNEGLSIEVRYWEVNLNLVYPWASARQGLVPFVGAGLNYGRESAERESLGRSIRNVEIGLGINVLVGARLAVLKSVVPFAEVRLEGGVARQLVFAGGVMFGSQ